MCHRGSDSGRRQGGSDRPLFVPLCSLSCRYLSRRRGRTKKSSRIKGTNYIFPQTFGLVSERPSVVISALSPQPPCFSLSRATCSRADNRCDPACTDSSRGTANPFICCRSSYLPHGEPAPLRPARTPLLGGQGYPRQPSVCTQTEKRRAAKRRWGGGGR